MSRHHEHHDEHGHRYDHDHEDRHGHDHGHRRHHHHDRVQQALARRLRRAGGDVTALEELQRDLEQAVADVAARIRAVREQSPVREQSDATG
jgi:hypothetical protein